MSRQEDPRIIVSMHHEYTTESQNLGLRTYEENRQYQVCAAMLKELIEAGVAEEIKRDKPFPRTPIKRHQVTVVPSVTRWISANGVDRHALVEGKPVAVPSNLAAHLKSAGLARIAA